MLRKPRYFRLVERFDGTALDEHGREHASVATACPKGWTLAPIGELTGNRRGAYSVTARVLNRTHQRARRFAPVRVEWPVEWLVFDPRRVEHIPPTQKPEAGAVPVSEYGDWVRTR